MEESITCQTKWKADNISKPLRSRCLSQKASSYVKVSLIYPLPSERTLKRCLSQLQVRYGIIDLNINVMKQQLLIVTKLNKYTWLVFDESSIGRPARETYRDRIIQS